MCYTIVLCYLLINSCIFSNMTIYLDRFPMSCRMPQHHQYSVPFLILQLFLDTVTLDLYYVRRRFPSGVDVLLDFPVCGFQNAHQLSALVVAFLEVHKHVLNTQLRSQSLILVERSFVQYVP